VLRDKSLFCGESSKRGGGLRKVRKNTGTTRGKNKNKKKLCGGQHSRRNILRTAQKSGKKEKNHRRRGKVPKKVGGKGFS